MGALTQLVSQGEQDVYLSGNPQFSFFKCMYHRYSNFAIQNIHQNSYSGTLEFGEEVSFTLKRSGDLISNMYLEVVLPPLTTANVAGSTWVGWCNTIGYALIETAEIQIGGQTIDRHYSQWMDIWNELTAPNCNHDYEQELLGKYQSTLALQNNAVNQQRYYVPFQFWFNRNPCLALPIIALQYSEVKLLLKFRNFNELIVSDVAGAITTASIRSIRLWSDYIFLDTQERKLMAQNKHQYLIEQLQQSEFNFPSIGTNIKSSLNLNHPVKLLAWVAQENSNLEQNIVTGNDYFNYTGSTPSPTTGQNILINNATLLLNGVERFETQNEKYFRTLQPLQYNLCVPRTFMYTYSFSLYPQTYKPSGSCNFSRIDDATLTFEMVTTKGAGRILVYALNQNLLNIQSGMAGVAFSN